MISFVPSTIWLMRESRYQRSIGTGSSPRARSESAGLVASPALQLKAVVHHLIAVETGEILRHRRFHADVLGLAIHPSGGKPRDRLDGHQIRAEAREFRRSGFVLTDGRAPLHAFRSPLPGFLDDGASAADRDRRKAQASGIQRDERELQALARFPR